MTAQKQGHAAAVSSPLPVNRNMTSLKCNCNSGNILGDVAFLSGTVHMYAYSLLNDTETLSCGLGVHHYMLTLQCE